MIEGIAKKTLGAIIDPNSGEPKKMARLGEVDGRVEEPVSSSNLFGKSEQDYIDQVVDRWRLFKNSLFFEKQKLTRDKEELNHKLSVSLRSEEELIANEQKKEIDLLDVEMGTNSAARKNMQEIFNSAEEQINDLKSHLNRPLDIKFVKTYFLLMAFLSLAEVPVNQMAFELFFESLPAISLLLSAAVGILFVFFAHVVGTQFKRTQCPLTALNKDRSYLAIFLITSMALLIMYFLGVMREALVETQNASSINLADLLAQSANESSDIGSKFNFVVGSKGIFLIIINFSIFLSGVLLAFFRHDSNPYYEDLSTLFEKAKLDLNNHIKQYEKRHVELLRGFKDRLNRNANLRFEIEKNIERITNSIQNIESQEVIYRERIIGEMRLCVQEYRKANKQVRKTDAPLYFTKRFDSEISELIL